MRDLDGLRDIVGGGPVVGLGESTHGSHEQFQIKHRMVRFLVKRLGFRTVAFEEDFAGGVLVDRYVRTGRGSAEQAVAGMSFPFWQTQEILSLVRWMRSYNEKHRDHLRFLGTDVIALRRHARSASWLVETLPNGGGGTSQAYAEQHARAIVGWYETYAKDTEFRSERELFIADTIDWWRRLTGHKVAYWAAAATPAPRSG